jgi:hypothetical protein
VVSRREARAQHEAVQHSLRRFFAFAEPAEGARPRFDAGHIQARTVVQHLDGDAFALPSRRDLDQSDLGLAGLLARRGRLDPVIDRISDGVPQAEAQPLDQRSVELDIAALHLQLRSFRATGSGVAHDTGLPLEHRPERDQACAQGQAFDLLRRFIDAIEHLEQMGACLTGQRTDAGAQEAPRGVELSHAVDQLIEELEAELEAVPQGFRTPRQLRQVRSAPLQRRKAGA